MLGDSISEYLVLPYSWSVHRCYNGCARSTDDQPQSRRHALTQWQLEPKRSDMLIMLAMIDKLLRINTN